MTNRQNHQQLFHQISTRFETYFEPCLMKLNLMSPLTTKNVPQLLHWHRAATACDYWFTLCVFPELSEVLSITSGCIHNDELVKEHVNYGRTSQLNPVILGLWLYWTFLPPMRPNTPTSVFCGWDLHTDPKLLYVLMTFSPTSTSFLVSCVTPHSYRLCTLSWVIIAQHNRINCM